MGFIILQTDRLFSGDTRDFAKANRNVCNLFDGSIMAKPVPNCGGTITGITHSDMGGIKTASERQCQIYLKYRFQPVHCKKLMFDIPYQYWLWLELNIARLK